MRVDVDFSGPLRTFSANAPGGCGAAGEGGSMSSDGQCPRARSAGVRVGCGATGSAPRRVALPAAMGAIDGPRWRLLTCTPHGKRSVPEKSRDGSAIAWYRSYSDRFSVDLRAIFVVILAAIC